jgi:hypothetical protein
MKARSKANEILNPKPRHKIHATAPRVRPFVVPKVIFDRLTVYP